MKPQLAEDISVRIKMCPVYDDGHMKFVKIRVFPERKQCLPWIRFQRRM